MWRNEAFFESAFVGPPAIAQADFGMLLVAGNGAWQLVVSGRQLIADTLASHFT